MTCDAPAPGESPRPRADPGRRKGLRPDDREIAGPLAWVTPWALAAVAVLATVALSGCAGVAEARSIDRTARATAAAAMAAAVQPDDHRATRASEWSRRGETLPREPDRRDGLATA